MRVAFLGFKWCVCISWTLLASFLTHNSYALSALQLTASTPANNSNNAARVDTVAVLTFSAPLNAATVSPNHVVLKHGTAIDPVTLNVSGNQVFVKAENELLPTTTYALTVVGVQGSAGELQSAPVNVTFRTRDGMWQTAQQIESTEYIGFNKLAMNKHGDAFSIWAQVNDVHHFDLMASRNSNGQWSTPQLVNSDLQGNVGDADVAVRKDGSAVTVWEESPYAWPQTPSRIWSNMFTPEKGWGTPQLIDTTLSQGGTAPKVAISSDGSAIVVWSQSIQGTHRIYFSRYTLNSGWEPATAIDAISHEPGSSNPRIAFDTRGNAFAIWQQVWHGTSLIWGNFYIPNRGWIAPHIVQSNWNSQGSRPDILFDGNGAAVAVWEQPDGVHAGRFTQSQGWSPSVALTGVADSHSPSLAVNSKGDAFVIWYQFDPTFNPSQPVNSVWGARFTIDNGWEASTLLQYPNRLDAFRASIAIDEAGNAIAVWSQSNGSFWRIYADRYQVGYGWIGRKVIDTHNTIGADDPHIAMDGNGNALAIWMQYGQSTGEIWANQFK